MFGLLILQEPCGVVMSGRGIVALAGIIVKANCGLGDTCDQL